MPCTRKKVGPPTLRGSHRRGWQRAHGEHESPLLVGAAVDRELRLTRTQGEESAELHAGRVVRPRSPLLADPCEPRLQGRAVHQPLTQPSWRTNWRPLGIRTET